MGSGEGLAGRRPGVLRVVKRVLPQEQSERAGVCGALPVCVWQAARPRELPAAPGARVEATGSLSPLRRL